MTLKVSVEKVNQSVGAPVETTNAGKDLLVAGAESADIVNPAAGVRFDAINGTTGISVTKGELIAVTVRVISAGATPGSLTVAYDQFSGLRLPTNISRTSGMPYHYTYLGGTGAVVQCGPFITLEYDGEFVVTPGATPVHGGSSSVGWVSSSDQNRRGLKFTMPVGARAIGAMLYIDLDQNADLILYDSDEYTVMTGFPITMDSDQRSGTAASVRLVLFPTSATLVSGSTYRLVLLPSTTTPNVAINTWTPSDDGAILGVSAVPGGTACAYTTFNGTPDSGSHTWTDTATVLPPIVMLLDQIDIPAGGSGGGFPILGGSVVR